MKNLDWTDHLEVVATEEPSIAIVRLKRNKKKMDDVFSALAAGARYEGIKERFDLKHHELVALQGYLFDVLTPVRREEFTGVLEGGECQATQVMGILEFADTWDHLKLSLEPLANWTGKADTKLGESPPTYSISGETSSGSSLTFKFQDDPSFVYSANSRQVTFPNTKTYEVTLSAKDRPRPSKSAGLLVQYHLKQALGGVHSCEVNTRDFTIHYRAVTKFEIASSDHFSGCLTIEPTAEGELKDADAWLTTCHTLANFLLYVLSFALGQRVHWAICRTHVKDQDSESDEESIDHLIEEVIRPSGQPVAKRINAVHFLNLQPLFRSAAMAFDNKSAEEREAIMTSIAWYLSGDTSEAGFIASTIALEHLVEELLGSKSRNILSDRRFRKLKEHMRKSLTDHFESTIAVCDEVLGPPNKSSKSKPIEGTANEIKKELSSANMAAIGSKISELNRRSAEDNLYALLDRHKVRYRDLGLLIKKVIGRRNGITHRGAFPGAPGDTIDRAAEELCIRVFQALLDLRDRDIQNALLLETAQLFPEFTHGDFSEAPEEFLNQISAGVLLIGPNQEILQSNRNAMALAATRFSSHQAPEALSLTPTTVSDQLKDLASYWLELSEVKVRLANPFNHPNLDDAFYFQESRSSPDYRVGLRLSRDLGRIWLLLEEVDREKEKLP